MNIDIAAASTDEVRRRLLELGGRAARQALAATAEDIELLVIDWAGRHTKPGTTTGALGRSVFARPLDDGDAWEVGTDGQIAPHALFVHWGTKPHPIYPKGASLATQEELFGRFGSQRGKTATGKLKPMPGGKKLVLRFAVGGGGGGFRFAQFVNHPGYKGDPWLDRAAAEAPKLFEKYINAAHAARG